jgi:hypothetical protein
VWPVWGSRVGKKSVTRADLGLELFSLVCTCTVYRTSQSTATGEDAWCKPEYLRISAALFPVRETPMHALLGSSSFNSIPPTHITGPHSDNGNVVFGSAR